MKVELDDNNYQAMIGRLAKGSMSEKVVSLKKLLFLYDTARSKIYLYERRITQCLQLLLIIEQNDLSLYSLTLLEKIIINTSAQSDIMTIIKKRLLSKIVLNLGSIIMNVRKISHKCILEYVRKFKDYETVVNTYLKTAISQTQNYHLKLKSINSLHSLLMTENKHFSDNLPSLLQLIQELMLLATQQDQNQIRRAALLCLVYVLRLLNQQILDDNNNFKERSIDCMSSVLERQKIDEKTKQQILSVFPHEFSEKILNKINSNAYSLPTRNKSLNNNPISPKNKSIGKRLVTDEPLVSLQKIDNHQQKQNQSQQKKSKYLLQYRGQRKVRKSQAEIQFKSKRIPIQKQQRTSIQKLPELKRGKGGPYLSRNQQLKHESPVKKSMTEKSIIYVEKQMLKQFSDPRNQLQKTLISMKDSSNWIIQFQSINCLRSIIEFSKQIITDQYLSIIITQLINSLNSLRSGICKISLMCLNQSMKKFGKRMYPMTQTITVNVLKKSIVTSDFIQKQIKKCLVICIEQLCIIKIINTINSLRDNKSIQIKLSVLIMLDSIVRIERLYKRQIDWIWNLLIQFHEQPHNNLRNQCKKIIQTLISVNKDWKIDAMILKKYQLEKIQRILRSCYQKGNQWMQIENQEFQKILANRMMTSKYFTQQYAKFQQLDRKYTLKKNWKDRIRLLNDVFNTAFQHPREFQANSNAKRYVFVLCDHLDQKNPGLLLNALNVLYKILEVFPSIVDESIKLILQKHLCVLQTKRAQLVSVAQKILLKIYKECDVGKVFRQLCKLSVSQNLKIKPQALNQLIFLLKQEELSDQNIDSILVKVLNRLVNDKHVQNFGRLKQLVSISTRKLGAEFLTKIAVNQKLLEMVD